MKMIGQGLHFSYIDSIQATANAKTCGILQENKTLVYS